MMRTFGVPPRMLAVLGLLAAAGAWQGRVGGIPPICGEVAFFPKAVLAAWSMPTSVPAPLNC
jgi:hypothetical protein